LRTYYTAQNKQSITLAVKIYHNVYAVYILVTGPPMNITINNITSTSFVVHWDEVGDAYQYNVRWRKGSGSVRAVTSQTSLNITGLIPNTAYNVTINAVNKCGSGNSISVTTSTIESLVPEMTSTTTTLSSTRIPPTGNVIMYCCALNDMMISEWYTNQWTSNNFIRSNRNRRLNLDIFKLTSNKDCSMLSLSKLSILLHGVSSNVDVVSITQHR